MKIKHQWLTLVSSIVQFFAVPALSGASDTIGRRVVLGGSLALSATTLLALGLRPNSIVAVAASQTILGVCNAITPVSQAIIVDLSVGQAGDGEVTHGLGLLGAVLGLAVSIGPILGGSLSELHRSSACVLCASMSLLALLSLCFYGWEETTPGPRLRVATKMADRGKKKRGVRPEGWFANPFSVLKVFFENRWVLLRN